MVAQKQESATDGLGYVSDLASQGYQTVSEGDLTERERMLAASLAPQGAQPQGPIPVRVPLWIYRNFLGCRREIAES